MLKHIRQQVIQSLWQRYRKTTPHLQHIEAGLVQRGISPLILDHFAIIDLPSAHSGIPTLFTLFEIMGYEEGGRGYLPDKQNDFCWMRESDSHTQPAKAVLPQAVIADFRLTELPPSIAAIIEKYAAQTKPAPFTAIKQAYDSQHIDTMCQLITHYLSGRDWPLPTIAEFHEVHAFNELLAWVLLFGRRTNHFTLSAHHLPHIDNLDTLTTLIETELHLPLNEEGGKIKGGAATGIAQASTKGMMQTIVLQDGNVTIPTGFVEFVWRFPHTNNGQLPTQWNDYFTGFVAQHANRVIESLYLPSKKDILCGAQG